MRDMVGPLPVVVPVLHTSAKTGENVEEAFHGLAGAILRGELAPSGPTLPQRPVP